MQIGTPGSAYGPSQVMSRPTLGRAVSPLPRGGDVIGAALSRTAVRPGPAPYDPSVLHRALGHVMQIRRAVQGGAVVPAVHPGAVIVHPGQPVDPTQLPFTPMPWEIPHAPGTAAFTVDPGALLARARLATLMGGS